MNMSDKVLVTYASKHGATAEIAEKIGGILREAGVDIDIMPVKQAKDPSAFGAVILGSAAYIGPRAVHATRRTTDEPVKVVYSHGAV